jgi:ATP-dependent Zn protease
MNESICPKCGIPCSSGICLLCGDKVKVEPQSIAEPKLMEPKPKAKKARQKSKEVEKVASANVQTITCNVTEVSEEEFCRNQPKMQTVKPFDDTNGFSKRNGKKELAIEQAKVDTEALQKRLADLENFEKEHHPEPKSWYTYFGNWFALLLALGMLYLIYWWVMSQGGMPAVYEFLRRIGL